jgi:hypothetical protein
MERCDYCNSKREIFYRDDNERVCYECYKSEIEFFCPVCLEGCSPNEVDYDFITLEDGVYMGEIEWLFGSLFMDGLIRVDSGEYESYVHGVCKECANEFRKRVRGLGGVDA